MHVARRAVGVALGPVRVAVAVPVVALAAVEGVVGVVLGGPGELRRVLELIDRVDALLTMVEPPIRRGARQVDSALIDDLIGCARAVPGLVESALFAVGRFELFVGHAETARVDAQQLLVDVAKLLGRVGSAVSAVEGVIDVAGTTVSAADRAVAGAEVVSAGAQVLLGQVDAVVGRAAGTADVAGWWWRWPTCSWTECGRS